MHRGTRPRIFNFENTDTPQGVDALGVDSPVGVLENLDRLETLERRPMGAPGAVPDQGFIPDVVVLDAPPQPNQVQPVVAVSAPPIVPQNVSGGGIGLTLPALLSESESDADLSTPAVSPAGSRGSNLSGGRSSGGGGRE